jgi:hypothetical protein
MKGIKFVKVEKYIEPPLDEGKGRAYCKCGTCGEPYFYDYIPYSLSAGIICLPCCHGIGEHRSGLKDVTREQFIELMQKKLVSEVSK